MDFWGGLFLFVILPTIGIGIVIFFILYWLTKRAVKDGTWRETFGSNDNDDE